MLAFGISSGVDGAGLTSSHAVAIWYLLVVVSILFGLYAGFFFLHGHNRVRDFQRRRRLELWEGGCPASLLDQQ